jgi:hypothetical protein
MGILLKTVAANFSGLHNASGPRLAAREKLEEAGWNFEVSKL